MTKSQPLVSPDVVRSNMERIRRTARELEKLAAIIASAYEEAYEHSLSPGSSGDGIPPGKAGFRVSDPTGDLATSGIHARMRWRVRRASKTLEAARRLRRRLLEAEDELVEAFAETDPEIREKLRRLREMEREIEEAQEG